MRKSLAQLTLWVGAYIVFALILYPINAAWMVLGLIIVPAIFLTWVDLARALRKVPPGTRSARFLGVIFGIPQALFGLASLLAGILIIVAFFFMPTKNGESNWSVLVVIPLLVFFGVRWLREAFKRG